MTKEVEKNIQEIDEIDQTEESMDADIYSGKNKKVFIISACAIVVFVIFSFFFFKYHTFHRYIESKSIEFDNSSNNDYVKFGKSIFKYSRDGAALLNEDGEQIWNVAYQMSKPLVASRGDTLVVADQGGNSMELFGKDGEKGSVKTSMPIQKIDVSTQGITAAILSADSSAEIFCYDTSGNILVEDQVNISKAGYPIDVTISDDGTRLFVSYLLMESRGISTKLVLYDLSDETSDEKVAIDEVIEDTVFPELFYMKSNIIAAVGEYSIHIYNGGKETKLLQEIKLDKEIHSVVHSEDYIVLILGNQEGENPYELRVYNTSGKIIGSKEFKGDYSKVIFEDGKIILDAGTSCKIFDIKGICHFDGNLEGDASGILPVSGMYKYALMRNEGITIIRLMK